MGFGSISLSNAQSLAADAQSLGNLKMEAGKNTPAAIKETAKQFESLFMRELMKSMREATMKSGLLDSAGGDLGTDLLDQQFAVQMSGQPGGLSDMIALQLTRQMAGAPKEGAAGAAAQTAAPVVGAKSTKSAAPSAPAPASAPAPNVVKTARAPTESQSNFVHQHAKVAHEV